MLTLTFVLERITKGTHRFEEPPQPNRPAVGTLYITKEALAKEGMLNATELEIIIRPKGVTTL